MLQFELVYNLRMLNFEHQKSTYLCNFKFAHGKLAEKKTELHTVSTKM